MVEKRGRNLTQEEQELQRSKGKLFRKHVSEACQAFLDDIGVENYDKIGIFLSGGVDSTTVLWDLISLGVRPRVYTYTTHMTKGMSTDHKKSKFLADYYRLPFKVVKMTEDPDELAQLIEKVFSDHIDQWDLTRADKEVPALFNMIMQEAKKDGIRYIFSGLAESNIHQLGRKNEIRGRAGEIGGFEMTIHQLSARSGQLIGISEMFVNNGIRLCLPHCVAIPRGAYHNIPWHVMNTPKSKSITLSAYETEMKESNLMPFVSSMQNGNSGARQYYDDMIPRSRHARALCDGKELSTATPYYNALQRKYDPVDEDSYRPSSNRARFAWMAHVNEGAPLDKDATKEHALYIDLKKSEAYSPILSVTSEDDDILGLGIEEMNYDEDEIIRPEDGNFSKLTDCHGKPLWMKGSFNKCEYAVKGLCTTYDSSVKKDIAKCDMYPAYKEYSAGFLKALGDIYSVKNNAYLVGGERAMAHLNGPDQPE